MPIDPEELSDEELDAILNSKMVQKYLAYSDLADGISALKEDGVMYSQLVQGINDRYSRVNKETIRSVLDAFVKEVETNTDALKSVDDDSEEEESDEEDSKEEKDQGEENLINPED